MTETNILQNKTIHFETIGCKLNQIETESIARCFTDNGFSADLKPVTAKSNESEPFLCVVNTCTVTEKAEQKARRLIRLLLGKYRTAPVIVTGCYAEVEHDSIQSLDSRIIVVKGTLKDLLADLPSYISKNIADEENLCNLLKKWEVQTLKSAVQVSKFKLSTDTFLHHSRGSIKIQDGCSNKCSYCRICIARGKPTSLPVKEVLERVKQIEASGQREIVITGVNLTLYNGFFETDKTETSYWNFAKLLSYLLLNTKTVSFRISSLYPEHVNDELSKCIEHERIRPHFHLSVQSGSDNVLKAMNRHYLSDSVINAVNKLREIKPEAFIACDIIAGFPGETEEDFHQTMDLCKKCCFTWIHAFPFSPRPGTAAYTMKNKVPQRIRDERIIQLNDFAKSQKFNYAKSFEGKEVKAIIEKRRQNFIRAVTENFLHVNLKGNYEELMKYAGQEVVIEITKALPITGKDEECEAEGIFIKQS